jgi:hypothetical protein
MESSLNIVELIENNPITKLSQRYNGKMLTKIREGFTDFEQQLFVSSFYCYLNCDPKNDFVIDLDNIWKWLGFSQKSRARELLEKNSDIDKDYKLLLAFESKQTNHVKGGHNIKKYMLTIKTFKSLCLKAGTKKAREIHEYYLKMEEIIHQVVQEESDELKLQLEQKDNIIMQIKETAEQEKLQISQKNKKVIEQITIDQFPPNTECVYFGTIDNTTNGEKLLKFGQTNDLKSRIYNHRGKFENFILVTAFKVQNKVEIENLIKSHPKIKKQLRCITLNNKVLKEIIQYDDISFTIDNLIKYVKEIIQSKQYSIDNYNALLKQNSELENEVAALKTKNEELNAIITTRDITILELNEIIKKQKHMINIAQEETKSVYILEPEDDLTHRFKQFINEMCIVIPEAQETSVSLEGRYRIWSRTKPTKEVFHAFKQYMDTKFRQQRIYRNGQLAHGYIGIVLKPQEYKRIDNSVVETFLFEACRFSPTGKIMNSVCLDEYKKWRTATGFENDNKTDYMKELKQYLNESSYVLKSTIWLDGTSNEGYYGLSLRTKDERVVRIIATTGKRIEKRNVKTNVVLNTWNTIASAAIAEDFSTAKMSRSVKNRVVFSTDDGQQYIYDMVRTDKQQPQVS